MMLQVPGHGLLSSKMEQEKRRRRNKEFSRTLLLFSFNLLKELELGALSISS